MPRSRTRLPGGRAGALSLAQQVFLAQLAVIVLLVAGGAGLAYRSARNDVVTDAEREVLILATALAELPEVHHALAAPDPSVSLQPTAESIRSRTGVDFVVFMAPDRTRYSHPNPDRIGGQFIGTIAPALAGGTVTETYTGTLGPSVRAVVPITGPDDSVIALVSVGVLQDRVGARLQQRLPPLAAVFLAALAMAAGGSLLISRRLHRQTRGLGPAEVTRMFEHHEAVLHAVREGLLVIDPTGMLVLANDEAARLLGLPPDAQGKPVRALGLAEPLAGLLAGGQRVQDQLHVYGDRVLVVNQSPTVRAGRQLGTVTTLRDHTEIQALAGELDSVRGFAQALQAHAHESANRLHTVVTMIELGEPERAVAFATSELAATQQLADQLTEAITEPALAALLLGKAAQAHERGVELRVADGTAVGALPIPPRELVTLVGNLLDNAIEAAVAAPPPRQVTVGARVEAGQLHLDVTDSGAGLATVDLASASRPGWSTKPASGIAGRGIGLALVQQVITRYQGTIEVDTGSGTRFTVVLPLAGRP